MFTLPCFLFFFFFSLVLCSILRVSPWTQHKIITLYSEYSNSCFQLAFGAVLLCGLISDKWCSTGSTVHGPIKLCTQTRNTSASMPTLLLTPRIRFHHHPLCLYSTSDQHRHRFPQGLLFIINYYLKG